MSFSNLNNLQQRLVISSLGTLLLAIAICLSYTPWYNLFFPLFTVSVITAAVWEYYTIAKAKGFQPLVKIGLIGSTFFAFSMFLRTQRPEAQMLPEIVLGGTLIAAFTYYFIKGSDPFVNLSITLFGILYLTVTLSCLIEINYFVAPPIVRDGRWSLVYLILVTKMTDTGAFFIGKKIGRRKLSPYISPKKTWEGAFGGLCSALITSLVLVLIFRSVFHTPPLDLSWWQSVWLAILISITAQFGDLAESLLKRDVGIKDSSSLPGLGGVLDVVDSLVFTSPLMYIFLNLQISKLP